MTYEEKMHAYQTALMKEIIEKQSELNALVEHLKSVAPHLFKSKSIRFEIPTFKELSLYIGSMGYFVDPEQFHAFYTSKNWMIGKNKMKCWKSALVNWNKRSLETKQKNCNPSNWNDKNNSFFDSMNSHDF